MTFQEQVAFLKKQGEIYKKEREERKRLLNEQKELEKLEPPVIKEKKEEPPLPKVEMSIALPKKEKKKKKTPLKKSVVKPKKKYSRNYYRESIRKLMRTLNISEERAIQLRLKIDQKKTNIKVPVIPVTKVLIRTYDDQTLSFFKLKDVHKFFSDYFNISIPAAKAMFYRDYYQKQYKKYQKVINIYVGRPNK